MKFPVTVEKKGEEKCQVFHPVDLKGWLDAGWNVEGDEPELDYKTPMDAYIATIEDETLKADFINAVQDVGLELKKDGSFNAKTIAALDEIVKTIESE